MQSDTCRKCGLSFCSPEYHANTDELVYQCNNCGYSWRRLPLDRKYSEEDSTPPATEESRVVSKMESTELAKEGSRE